MSTLAILGGKPVRSKPFPGHKTVGEEEKQAVARVIDSGILSGFLGAYHEGFYGGPEVRALEAEWCSFFGCRHAMAVNSCTSGLMAAVGGIGVEPGDEVIVTPYTMSATATAAVVYGAIPVFADIEPQTFCLDPESIRARIRPGVTRAILVTDLFGHPFQCESIGRLAEEFNLRIIEDAAQAPGAKWGSRFAGTLGHVGVFSLNYHKHIHCGEGGVVVTDDDELAERIRLIRNHAEAVVEAKGVADLSNMVGFNFRMTEIQAAIARCQLRKLPGLLEQRLERAAFLAEHLGSIPGLKPPVVRSECRHAFYVQAFRFDERAVGVSRDRFVNAVRAELPVTELREREGVKLSQGYVKPLYLQPMFQRQVAFGTGGYPFNLRTPVYPRGLCPVAEQMHFQELFLHEFLAPSMGRRDLQDVADAFAKVWEAREFLGCRGGFEIMS